MLVSTRNHARDWSLLLARLLQHLMRVPIPVARTLGPNEDTTSSCSMSSAQGNSCIVGTSGDPRRVKDRNRNFGLPRNGVSQLSFQSDTSCGASKDRVQTITVNSTQVSLYCHNVQEHERTICR